MVEGNSSIPAGWFHEDGILIDDSHFFGGIDHGEADTVLHAVGWIEKLQFCHHLRAQAFGDTVQFYEWSITDQFCDVTCDFHN